MTDEKLANLSDDGKAFLRFVDAATSPYHAVAAASAALRAAGFSELALGAPWMLAAGGNYFVNVYDGALLAFTVGGKGPLRMAAAHTDFPTFRLKAEADAASEAPYAMVNVEPYGGMIYRTWLDRPLGVAGKIVTQGKDAFHPETHLVDCHEPVMTIPSLAIHMDRDVNKKGELNAQKDMMPIAALPPETARADWWLEKIQGGRAFGEVLSYDLMAYPLEQGCTFGYDHELLSSPRLDNMTSVWACVQGLIAAAQAGAPDGVRLIALFDNEEVGSRTKQGAGSAVLMEVLRRIYASAAVAPDDAADAEERLMTALADGFLLSCDVAHGTHPSHVAKMDPYVHPQLGAGVVLKQAASQRYAGDAEAIAIVRALCEAHAIPCQTFVNRSDTPGGATLGSIASALVPVRTMDVGVPILAMHSARETMGTADEAALTALVHAVLE